MSDELRTRLVDAGTAILERDGLGGLSVRNLATEVGTSTMAVYTHFGGMTGVLDAVASAAFARFADALRAVARTDDPVADLVCLGLAYRDFALASPERYQLMFGTSAPSSLSVFRTDLTVTGSATARADWSLSFDVLVAAVRRVIAAGRIRDDGEVAVAGRFWSVTHGGVTLEMAGFYGHEGHALTDITGPLSIDVFVGMGDERAKAARSVATALGRAG